jgi:UDP-N-acetylglucosamine 4,6-dehydratase (inverting)
MKKFKNKSILITGGTGFFGKNFVNYLLKNKFPFSRIIIFSRDEFKQDQLQKELNSKKHQNLRFFLGDVRDKDRLLYAFKELDFVIHAAALKQVPAAEYNPIEFIKTNILGAQNIVEASLERNVSKVLAVSTDKAVAPINLYGATKLCLEKLFISSNNFVGNRKICFSCVRYGNVLGSRGSVLPLFLEQEKKNFFTITDSRMTRFNIMIEDCIKIVFFALENSIGGEIFVPRVSSINIVDLAKAINSKKKIKYIGLRPGEKLHEELLQSSDSFSILELKNYYVIINKYNKSDKILSYYKKNFSAKFVPNNFSYNSKENNFLSVSEIRNQIEKIKV